MHEVQPGSGVAEGEKHSEVKRKSDIKRNWPLADGVWLLPDFLRITQRILLVPPKKADSEWKRKDVDTK